MVPTGAAPIPVPARFGRRRGPRGADVGVVLVGHGSRSARGNDEMQRIADLIADARPGIIVELGFLEMAQPPAAAMLDDLVARGCRRIVVLPLLLLGAGHAKSDVPAVVVEARLRHPGVPIAYGSPLGVSRDLVAVAGAKLSAAATTARPVAGDPPEPHPVLLIARGTTDPDANAEAMRAARLVAEWHRATMVHVGYTGMTWPLVPDALAQMALLTPGPFSVFFWFLGHGRLIERARGDIAAFRATTQRSVVDAGYFGPDPGLVRPILARLDEAFDGVTATNCDVCRFRAPFPGHADQVGQAIGVGHSHLAVEHRGPGAHGGAGQEESGPEESGPEESGPEESGRGAAD